MERKIIHHISYWPQKIISLTNEEHKKTFGELDAKQRYFKKLFYGIKNCIRNNEGIILRKMTQEEKQVRKKMLQDFVRLKKQIE